VDTVTRTDAAFAEAEASTIALELDRP